MRQIKNTFAVIARMKLCFRRGNPELYCLDCFVISFPAMTAKAFQYAVQEKLLF